MNPTDALRFRTELENKRVYSPDEARRNIAATLEGAARSTPILSNALSVRDAIEFKDEAKRLESQGDAEGARRARAQSVAGALSSAMPFSLGSNTEGAASRAGVFVPAGEKATQRARELADKIAKGERISAGSGRFPAAERGFVSPEGIVKSEISDQPMRIKPGAPEPQTIKPLGDVIEHPELFDRYPSLTKSPVFFGPQTGKSDPVSRTFGQNMELAPRHYDSRNNPDWMRRNIAKLLQYKVSEGSNFALATKHGTDNTLSAIEDALQRTKAAMEANQLSNVGNKYLHYLNGLRDRINKRVRRGPDDPWVLQRFPDADMTPTRKDIARVIDEGVSKRVAGNLEAQTARQRFSAPDDMTPPGNMNYSDLIVLPPAGGNIGEFVNNWARYGQGSGRYGRPMPLDE